MKNTKSCERVELSLANDRAELVAGTIYKEHKQKMFLCFCVVLPLVRQFDDNLSENRREGETCKALFCCKSCLEKA